jgi:hypothetical protein
LRREKIFGFFSNSGFPNDARKDFAGEKMKLASLALLLLGACIVLASAKDLQRLSAEELSGPVWDEKIVEKVNSDPQSSWRAGTVTSQIIPPFMGLNLRRARHPLLDFCSEKFFNKVMHKSKKFMTKYGLLAIGYNKRFEGMTMEQASRLIFYKAEPQDLMTHFYPVSRLSAPRIPASFDWRQQVPNCVHPVLDQAAWFVRMKTTNAEHEWPLSDCFVVVLLLLSHLQRILLGFRYERGLVRPLLHSEQRHRERRPFPSTPHLLRLLD